MMESEHVERVVERRGKETNEARRITVISLYSNGTRVCDISRALGMPESTVRRAIKAIKKRIIAAGKENS
jgi:transposase